jgi:O-acetylserine/cysteine efflux transporter
MLPRESGDLAAVTSRLSLRDALLALAVVFIWGTNFVVVRWGLGMLPPLLMAACRFTLVVCPAIFFLKKPGISWGMLALYGGAVGTGQFGLLYIAMDGFISPGIASVVMQIQVFFTIGIAMMRDREKLALHHVLGLASAAAGLSLIARHNGEGATTIGLALVLGGAMCWAISNQTAREAARSARTRGGPLNPLAFVVWASLFAAPGLFAASLLLEGPARIATAVTTAPWIIWATLIWQSAANTLFGYVVWAWLLGRHPAATVAPMSLLVPVFGIGASVMVLGEKLQGWKIAATLLVMAGVAINLLWRPRKTAAGGEAS